MTQKNKRKVKEIVGMIILALFEVIMRGSILLCFAGFFIVFINANIKYFQELPHLILFAIPIGFIAIVIELFGRNWRKHDTKK